MKHGTNLSEDRFKLNISEDVSGLDFILQLEKLLPYPMKMSSTRPVESTKTGLEIITPKGMSRLKINQVFKARFLKIEFYAR